MKKVDSKKINLKKIDFKKFKIDNKVVKKVLPIVVLIVVVSICMSVGITYIKPKEKDNTNLGISNELVKDKTYLNLSIQNIEIEEGENLVHLMANIFNNGETFTDRMVDIVFLDQDQKEIGRAPTYISQIEQGGAIRIDTVIDRKSAKAYTFKVEG